MYSFIHSQLATQSDSKNLIPTGYQIATRSGDEKPHFVTGIVDFYDEDEKIALKGLLKDACEEYVSHAVPPKNSKNDALIWVLLGIKTLHTELFDNQAKLSRLDPTAAEKERSTIATLIKEAMSSEV